KSGADFVNLEMERVFVVGRPNIPTPPELKVAGSSPAGHTKQRKDLGKIKSWPCTKKCTKCPRQASPFRPGRESRFTESGLLPAVSSREFLPRLAVHHPASWRNPFRSVGSPVDSRSRFQ